MTPSGRAASKTALREQLRREAATLVREPRPKKPPPIYGLQEHKRRGRRKGARQPIYAASEGNCCVYVIGAPNQPVKIGLAVDVAKRLSQLQTGFPHRLKIYEAHEVSSDRARSIERSCHMELRDRRLNGEWFDVTPTEAAQVLRRFTR
jgi:hypothetical protein